MGEATCSWTGRAGIVGTAGGGADCAGAGRGFDGEEACTAFWACDQIAHQRVIPERGKGQRTMYHSTCLRVVSYAEQETLSLSLKWMGIFLL